MSPEKQRIAIAEACGWEWKKYGDTMAWYNGSMKWVRAVCGICPDIVPVNEIFIFTYVLFVFNWVVNYNNSTISIFRNQFLHKRP